LLVNVESNNAQAMQGL